MSGLFGLAQPANSTAELNYFAAGGTDSGSVRLASVERFKRSADTWAFTTAMPTALNLIGFGDMSDSYKLMRAGGSNGSNLSTTEVFSSVGASWASKAAMPATASNKSLTGQRGAGYTYFTGGQSNTDTASWRYDESGDSFSTLTSMTIGYQLAHSTIYSGSVYVSGQDAVADPDYALQIYNISGNAWSTKTRSSYTGSDGGGAQARAGALMGTSIFYARVLNDAGADNCAVEYNITGDTWTVRASALNDFVIVGGPTLNDAVLMVSHSVYGKGGVSEVTSARAFEYHRFGDVWRTCTTANTARNDHGAMSCK